MIRVGVTDYTFDDLDVETQILRPLGCLVVGRQCKTPTDVAALVADADHVITQFAPVDAAAIAAMRKARVIVRYGIGVDNVDLDAARAKGIPVCNIPDYCIDEVADHTLALILCAARQVVANSNAVQHAAWKLAVPLETMKTLRDMTVGVVGCGRIGREVVARLRPFGCRILVDDPRLSAAEIANLGAAAANRDELLSTSDLVTLHCPSTAQTRGMINHRSLARTKPGAILVNVARGDLVDTEALIDALRRLQVGCAAIDVCQPEPPPPDSPLLKMERVIITSHIASASVKAVRTLRETAARIVACSVRGERLPNIVNGVEPTGP